MASVSQVRTKRREGSLSIRAPWLARRSSTSSRRGRFVAQPGRREQAEVFPQDPVRAGETPSRIFLLDARFERLEGFLEAAGAQQGPGEEAVARGVVRPVQDGFLVGVDRQPEPRLAQPFETLAGQPPQVDAAREEVDERAVGPRRRCRLPRRLPRLAQRQQGQHVARRLGAPGLGQGAGLRDPSRGQVLHHLGETPGVRRSTRFFFVFVGNGHGPGLLREPTRRGASATTSTGTVLRHLDERPGDAAAAKYTPPITPPTVPPAIPPTTPPSTPPSMTPSTAVLG